MIWLWCTRVIWALPPGHDRHRARPTRPRGWSTAPARVAAVILWAVWAAGLFALFAPRPWGLTLLRVVAPCGFVCVVLSLTSTSAASAALALVGGGIAAVLALSAPIAIGDRERARVRRRAAIRAAHPDAAAARTAPVAVVARRARRGRSGRCCSPTVATSSARSRRSSGYPLAALVVRVAAPARRAAGSCSFPPASRSPIR